MNHFYVAIVAPFGSGKTILMKNLVKRCNASAYAIHNTDHQTLEETIELYPNNFKNKTDFIQSRILDNDATTIINAFKQTNENKPSLFIGDSSYHEHYCYIMTLYQSSKLKNHEYKRLAFKFYTILKSLPNPDMYIYVDVPIDKIVENIKARGREYELKDYVGIRKYVTDLKRRYLNLFFTHRNYRYPHNLIQSVFSYIPGSEHHTTNYLDIEKHITLSASKKFNKIIIDQYAQMQKQEATKCK